MKYYIYYAIEPDELFTLKQKPVKSKENKDMKLKVTMKIKKRNRTIYTFPYTVRYIGEL